MGIPSKEENDLKPFGLAKWLSPRGIVPSGSALVPWGEKSQNPHLCMTQVWQENTACSF